MDSSGSGEPCRLPRPYAVEERRRRPQSVRRREPDGGKRRGFTYNEAFRGVIDATDFGRPEANLDQPIPDPDQLIPGTRVAEDDTEHEKAFRNMQVLDQRRALIAYLRTLE